MKKMINFTTSEDDIGRYRDARDLEDFYRSFGIDGLELMPLDDYHSPTVRPDMVIGIHALCMDDWIDRPVSEVAAHYRKHLDIAKELGAEYIVVHVSQISIEETLGEPFRHTDEEVIEAFIRVANELLDGQKYSFWFLMENMWYPGLTFLRPDLAKRLIEGIHYEKAGFMLDTGHYLHTNLDLKTEKEAVDYLLDMADKNEAVLPYIKGIHLQQSLTGEFVKNYMANRPPLETDPDKLFTQLFTFIFQVDLHHPFSEPKICDFLEKVQPLYLTQEYITDSRETHERYLKTGTKALKELHM